jgi:DNA-binding HxlR family transcriptional regulator
VLVLAALLERSYRFSELRRHVGGVSEKMLAQTLQSLERDGFVLRDAKPVIPPRVDYELTPLGRDLLVPLRAIGEWAVTNRERVLAARERFLEDNPEAAPGHIARVELPEHPQVQSAG